MKIEINNLQRFCRPDIQRIRNLVHGLMQKANALDRNTSWSEISIIFLDNKRIKALKARLFGIDEVTDVISQRYAAIPGDNRKLTGEIYVNVQRAIENSTARWDASRELALYLAHGCDHLMNSRDDTRDGYTRMRRRELNWLRGKKIAGLTGKTLKQLP